MSNKLTHSADTPKSQITDLAGCLLIEVECRTPSDAMLLLYKFGFHDTSIGTKEGLLMSNKLTHSADTPKSQITDLAGCLLTEVECRTPSDAMLFLSQEPDAVIAKVLSMINPSLAMKILQRFQEDRRQAILPQTPSQCSCCINLGSMTHR